MYKLLVVSLIVFSCLPACAFTENFDTAPIGNVPSSICVNTHGCHPIFVTGKSCRSLPNSLYLSTLSSIYVYTEGRVKVGLDYFLPTVDDYITISFVGYDGWSASKDFSGRSNRWNSLSLVSPLSAVRSVHVYSSNTWNTDSYVLLDNLGVLTPEPSSYCLFIIFMVMITCSRFLLASRAK